MNQGDPIIVSSFTPAAAASAPLQKASSKTVRDFQILESDRLPLADAANTIVNTLVMRQISPMLCGAATAVELDLTAAERATYDAALDYLRRQFAIGYREAEPIERRAESDISNEWKP